MTPTESDHWAKHSAACAEQVRALKDDITKLDNEMRTTAQRFQIDQANREANLRGLREQLTVAQEIAHYADVRAAGSPEPLMFWLHPQRFAREAYETIARMRQNAHAEMGLAGIDVKRAQDAGDRALFEQAWPRYVTAGELGNAYALLLAAMPSASLIDPDITPPADGPWSAIDATAAADAEPER